MKYKVRIRLTNPLPMLLMKLESAMVQKNFRSLGGSLDGGDNYYVEYHYACAKRTEKEVCALAYSIAEQVQKGPAVLVDKI